MKLTIFVRYVFGKMIQYNEMTQIMKVEQTTLLYCEQEKTFFRLVLVRKK